MYTLCPSCKTLFGINAQQLAAAQGRVRCSVCRTAFSALDNLSEHPDELLAPGRTPKCGERMDAQEPPPGRTPKCGERSLPASLPPATLVLPCTSQDAQEPPPDVSEAPVDAASAASVQHAADEFDLINAPPIAAEDRLTSDSPAVPVPKRISVTATLAWSVINLGLIAILAVQFVYFNRHDLAQYAEWRPALEDMCQYAGCDLPPQRDITKIILANRELRSHPEVPNALLVTATLVNNATFVQPYPLLQLSLSDFSGRTVAMRRFQPAEYMGKIAGAGEGMLPGRPVEVSLELADPGKAAVGFEFSFI